MKKILLVGAAIAMVACSTKDKATSMTTSPRMEQTRIPAPVTPEVPKSTEMGRQTPQSPDTPNRIAVGREIPQAPKPPMQDSMKMGMRDASGNLTGLQSQDSFMQAPFNSWFQPRYDGFNPDPMIVESLKSEMDDVEIRAYMGTWCGDSKRETPMFYKLLNEVEYDMDNLTMITVDRTKKQPVDLVSGYDVMRVPTFIFYRDGKEIGRYVERPRESQAKDILKIVSGQDYKHSYEN